MQNATGSRLRSLRGDVRILAATVHVHILAATQDLNQRAVIMQAFQAADALLLTREAIVDTAARQGRPATLLPKPFEDRSASGSHVHFSVYKVRVRCLMLRDCLTRMWNTT